LQWGGTPLPHLIESHLEARDGIAVIISGLTQAEADHIEESLARDEEMVVYTDYEQGYSVIAEPIPNAAVAAREATGNTFSLLIRDVTRRPPVPHRPLWQGDWRHGSGIGRD
jgi:hypothetical protein